MSSISAMEKNTIGREISPSPSQQHQLPIRCRNDKDLSMGSFSGVFPMKTFPKTLRLLIDNFNKNSSVNELQLLIWKLCEYQPLTAQQLAEILKRKDKNTLLETI